MALIYGVLTMRIVLFDFRKEFFECPGTYGSYYKAGLAGQFRQTGDNRLFWINIFDLDLHRALTEYLPTSSAFLIIVPFDAIQRINSLWHALNSRAHPD